MTLFLPEILSHPGTFGVLLAVIFGIIAVGVPSFRFIFAASGALIAALVSFWSGWAVQFGAFSLPSLG